MSDKMLDQLFTECTDWYKKIVINTPDVPKVLYGITSGTERFFFLLDFLNELQMDHRQRHKFIKVVLEEENAEAYVYGTLVMTIPDRREYLDLVAADTHRYIWGTWQVIRNSDDRVQSLQFSKKGGYQDPEEYPGAWFLTDTLSVTKNERRSYSKMWNQFRNIVQLSTTLINPIQD